MGVVLVFGENVEGIRDGVVWHGTVDIGGKVKGVKDASNEGSYGDGEVLSTCEWEWEWEAAVILFIVVVT